ncbi:MAG: hypothetical protein WAZ34_15155 [Rhodocyclaceae bacterium]
MKGYIQSLPAGIDTGQISGMDGVTYAFYLIDFSPDDLTAALEEMESVEFEAVPGSVNRAMNCVRLRAAPAEIDAAANTPEVDEPCLYSPPAPAPLLCKGQLPPEWKIISISEWCVRGSSKDGSNEARQIIAHRARELKANAILDLEYGIVGTDGEGSKTHVFQGRLAIAGKKDPEGKPPEMLAVDLNQSAEALLNRLELRRQSAQSHNYALYAICFVFTLIAGSAAGFSSLFTLIVGTIALGFGAKLRKNTRLEKYVTRIPIVPPTTSEPAAPAASTASSATT